MEYYKDLLGSWECVPEEEFAAGQVSREEFHVYGGRRRAVEDGEGFIRGSSEELGSDRKEQLISEVG